jgi:hypothetical protein
MIPGPDPRVGPGPSESTIPSRRGLPRTFHPLGRVRAGVSARAAVCTAGPAAPGVVAPAALALAEEPRASDPPPALTRSEEQARTRTVATVPWPGACPSLAPGFVRPRVE